MSEAVGVGIGWDSEKERVVVWVLRRRVRWVEGRVDVDMVGNVLGDVEMIERVVRLFRDSDTEVEYLDRRTLVPMFIAISQPCTPTPLPMYKCPFASSSYHHSRLICVHRNRVTDRLFLLVRPPEFINVEIFLVAERDV